MSVIATLKSRNIFHPNKKDVSRPHHHYFITKALFKVNDTHSWCSWQHSLKFSNIHHVMIPALPEVKKRERHFHMKTKL